jgi:MFS family permease
VPNRLLTDLAPLRASRDFRLLFLGQVVSMTGSQFTMVAIAYQVYSLTRSSLLVGAIGMAQLVPFVVGSAAGGSLGDAKDRRTVLVVASAVLAVTSAGLAFNAATGHASVLAVYLVSAVAAGFGAVVSTICSAAVPSLVRRDQLTAAYASMQVVDQVGMVAGPALAGVLISVAGLPWTYALDSFTFLVSTSSLLAMSALAPRSPTERPGLRSIVEGLAYIRASQVLQGVFLVDLSATVFGLPTALFPQLARSTFHHGPGILGLLYAAPAAGALVGALVTGPLQRVRRRTWAITAAVCVWGGVIVAFGYVRLLWAALLLLSVAGWADVVSAVLRDTVLQISVPERFRSRATSVQTAVVEGGPRLGAVESGAVAQVTSAQFSIVSGGLICIAGALALMALLPGWRNETDKGTPTTPFGLSPGSDVAAAPGGS